MGFINDLVNTVINTGKRSIQDEVKEQTENVIESVSKKVSDTVKNAGDAVETTVKTTVDNIGKPKESAEAQSAQSVAPAANAAPAKTTNNAPTKSTSDTSVAGDVANILEKKNIMSKDEVSKAASVFEAGVMDQINQVTDLLNAAYDKDATSNDNTKSIVESVDHFLDATKNIGTATSNEAGKAINDSFKDQKFNEVELKEARETLTRAVDKAQEELDDYKKVS